jgi:hypothetical protein
VRRAALAGGFEEDDRAGGRDIERRHLARHGDAQEVVAGAADQVVQTGPFSAKDDYGIGREVAAVVILGASLVESDNPEVVGFEGFKGADEVDDTGEAEMLGGSGGGLDRGGAERGGAAFGEEDAIDAGGFGSAKKSAKVLRVFHAVESEDEAGVRTGEEVFDFKEGALADEGDNSLVSRGAGETGEGFAGFGAEFDASGVAELGYGREAGVAASAEALLGDADVVEAAAPGSKGLLDGMEAVQNIHR